MGNITSGYNNYVEFRLTATNVDSLVLTSEPIGWSEDDLELDRHKDYHGIFTNFTNNLEFIGEAKDYIIRAYQVGGINAKLILTKGMLVDDGTDLIFKTRYTAIADFSTMVKTASKVTIKFNSNNLAELIKSHESDEFEIETEEDIDGNIIDELILDKAEIKGRDILQTGESVVADGFSDTFGFSLFGTGAALPYRFINKPTTVLTTIVSRGMDRHSSVVVIDIVDNSDIEKASNMFYVDQTSVYNPAQLGLDLDVQYDLDLDINGDITIQFEKYKWTGSIWVLQQTVSLGNFNSGGIDQFINHKIKDTYNFGKLGFDEGVMLAMYPLFLSRITVNKHTLILGEKTQYDSSPNLSCIFTHDLTSRLLYIITGRNNAYYSKYFGRTELGYVEDGEAGLVANIGGYWIRAFDKDSEKYKSLKISLKDLLDSRKAVFNVGIGIETVNLQERLREEDLKYFYQNEVAVRLPEQITNVKRTVDKNLLFSGLTFGYTKSGDYEDSVGLDEPNTKTEYVTPIRKSTKKYQRTSKVRADEYGLELARRKPQDLYPTEDTKYDDNNWFLDLKRTIGLGYEQKDYTDRLQEMPTGIQSPETFRSSFFTPLRMLMRHAWVFRSGMELYLDKIIKYISKDKNSTLKTKANLDWNKALDKSYSESENIIVRDLERSRFLPEIVEFDHPVNDSLMDLINETTKMTINGSEEDVPNMYFKFEYTNENGNLERGYLLNLKPNKEGKWKMQLSNEEIIT